MPTHKTPLLLLLIFLLVSGIIWSRDISRRSFLADDYIYLYAAERVSTIGSANFSHWGPSSHLRPATWFIVFLEDRLFGLNAGAHHALHLALHLLNGILLCVIFSLLFPDHANSAAIAAGLFLLHPIQAEPLCWASGAVDIICGFFMLSAVAAYLGARLTGRWELGFLFIITMLLALYSKETGVAAVLLVPIVDMIRGVGSIQTKIRANLKWWGLVLSITFIYAISRVLILGGFAGPSGGQGEPDVDIVPSSGILKTALPSLLSRLIAPLADQTVLSVRVWVIVFEAIIFGWLVYGLVNSRSRRIGLFGLIWSITAMLPALPVFNVGADLERSRYLYLSSAGFCLMMVSPIISAARSNLRIAAIAIAVSLLFILEITGIVHNMRPWLEAYQITRGIQNKVAEAKSQWNEGDAVVIYDLPLLHDGAQLLGNNQTLSIAMNMAVFAPERWKNSHNKVFGILLPIKAMSCGFISEENEIPPPDWDVARLGNTDFVFQYRSENTINVTALIKSRIALRKQIFSTNASLEPLEIYNAETRDLASVNNLTEFSPGTFRVSGPTPYIIFQKMNISPILAGQMEIEMAIQPGAFKSDKIRAAIYWSADPLPKFNQDRWATFPLINDTEPHIYRVDLANRPRFIISPGIHWMRLDPGAGVTSFHLVKVRLLQFSTGQTNE